MKDDSTKIRTTKTKWPKVLPELTSEQLKIKDDWMKYWHEALPSKYGVVERFNHGFPLRVLKDSVGDGSLNTLEIGAGLGEHIAYENLNNQHYSVLELRENMADVLKEKFSSVNVYIGDIQEKTSFEDKHFDRIIAVHVLEHLPDLPKALYEIHRVLKSDGSFTAVIPCEGSLAYSLARKISGERLFKKKFNMEYDWLIKTEHINKPHEILEEVEKFFSIVNKSYFPLIVPFIFCNLCIGINMIKNEV